MQILMLKTTKGSNDGVNIIEYIEGVKYQIPDSLGNVFINELKVAKLHVPKKEKKDKKVEIEIPEQIVFETPKIKIIKPKIKRKRKKVK